ncbi:MAG: RluA family pseudouridine synthase [Myxococcota bacterium]
MSPGEAKGDPAPAEPTPITHVVGEGEVPARGERVDKVLAGLGFASRSTLQRWIEDGRVRIDGAPAQAKQRVRPGQRLEVRPAPPPPSAAVPQDLPLDVRFEDAHLVVVHKPAGLVVHPAPGHPDGTLVNALLHHVDFSTEGGDPMRPGIVHRLDRFTSGVMVVAKSVRAREGLVALFQAHDVERRYDAIALGALPGPVTYETLHGRHPRDRKKFSGRVERGKRAVTHVVPVAGLPSAAPLATHVACRLETGRTHQIRVHLAEAGHPLLGDPLYGKTPKDPRLRAAATALGRQALHAATLGFAHPVTGEPMRFEAELPEDFRAARDALGAP